MPPPACCIACKSLSYAACATTTDSSTATATPLIHCHCHCHDHRRSSISHNSFVETRITATRSMSTMGELVSKQYAAKVVQRSIRNPHLLLGWEIFVDKLGIGYVTGLRTSHFFSTRFRVQVGTIAQQHSGTMAVNTCSTLTTPRPTLTPRAVSYGSCQVPQVETQAAQWIRLHVTQDVPLRWGCFGAE